MVQKEIPVDEVLRMYSLGADDSSVIRSLTERGYSPVQINEALTQSKMRQETIASPAQPRMMPSALPEYPKATPLQEPAKIEEMVVPKPSSVPPSPNSPAMPAYPERPKPQEIQQSQQPQEQQFGGYPYAYPTYEEQQQQQPMMQPKMDTEAIEELAEEIVNEKWQEVKTKISDVIEWKAYADRRINSIDERIKKLESSIDRLQAALLSKVNEYGRGIKNLSAEMSSIEGALGKVLSPLVDNVKELGSITQDLKKSSPKKVVKKRTKKKKKRK